MREKRNIIIQALALLTLSLLVACGSKDDGPGPSGLVASQEPQSSGDRGTKEMLTTEGVLFAEVEETGGTAISYDVSTDIAREQKVLKLLQAYLDELNGKDIDVSTNTLESRNHKDLVLQVKRLIQKIESELVLLRESNSRLEQLERRRKVEQEFAKRTQELKNLIDLEIKPVLDAGAKVETKKYILAGSTPGDGSPSGKVAVVKIDIANEMRQAISERNKMIVLGKIERVHGAMLNFAFRVRKLVKETNSWIGTNTVFVDEYKKIEMVYQLSIVDSIEQRIAGYSIYYSTIEQEVETAISQSDV